MTVRPAPTPLRPLLLAGAAHLTVSAAALAAFGSSFRTNDDAYMLASVSGFTGGQPRPEMVFSHVGVGLVLRWLYRVAPGVPWYGLYLQALLAVAMIVLVAAALHLLGRKRAPAPALAAAVGGATAAWVAVEVSSLQFTVVAILLAGGGVLAAVALRDAGARASTAALVGGGIALLGLAVRLQGFVVGVLIAGSAALLHGLVRRRLDLRGGVALAAVLLIGAGAAVAAEAAWWRTEAGTPRAIGILDSGLRGDDGPANGVRRIYSENDRTLIETDWMRFPEEQFAFTPGRDPAQEALAADRLGPLASPAETLPGALAAATRADRIGETLRTQALPLAVALLVALAAPTRRGRILAVATVAGATVLLIVVGGTRLPDRVSGPALLLALVLALVVGHAEPAGARRWVPRVAAGMALAAAAVQVTTLLGVAAERAADAEARRERATVLLRELEDLGGDDATFVLWLVDPWVVVRPLDGSGPDAYHVRTVEVVAWASTMPYNRGMRDDLGMTDWIAAVVERDDVLLVASAERVERFRILLRERRGLLCTEPEVLGVVNGGFDVLVRRFEEVPCDGTVIAP